MPSKYKKPRESDVVTDVTNVIPIPNINPFVRSDLQLSIENSAVYEILPTTDHNRYSAINFVIKGNHVEWVNLASIRLRVGVKITEADGGELSNDYDCGPCAYLGSSLFQDISVRLRANTVVTPENQLYPYKGLINTEYLQPRFVQEQEDYSNCNFRDKYDSMDAFGRADPVPPALVGPWDNPGFGKRATLARNSEVIYMLCKIHSEITLQEKWIPSFMDVGIKLSMNTDAFVIKGDMPAAQRNQIYAIDSLSLFVEKAVLTPSLDLELSQKIQNSGFIMPVNSVQMVKITKAVGIQTFKEPILLNRPLPDKVFLMQVESRRTAGSYVLNPLKLKFSNYDRVSLLSGNLVFPQARSFLIQADLRDALRCWDEFLFCTGSKDSPTGRTNEITYGEFLSTRGIVCFDMTRSHLNSIKADGIPRIADLYLDVALDEALTQPTDFILYIQRKANIYFTSNFDVKLDYF